MNKYDMTEYDLQNIRKLCNMIVNKEFKNELFALSRKLLNRVRDILSTRRNSLEYILPSQTTLENMAQDSFIYPSKYYNFSYFDFSCSIVYDDCCIDENSCRLIKDTCSVYYHIKVVGFKNSLDLPCYFQSKLKRFSYYLIGNFDNLVDCLKYYRRLICDFLLSRGVEGVTYGLF